MSDLPASDSREACLPLADDGEDIVPRDVWRVLIVDDDEDVHRATRLALRGALIEGRDVDFLHARSAAEALGILAGDNSIAAVLLDVVMEAPDAGLRLVRRLREDYGRSDLRIILHTGQPGYAPEIETVRDFGIDDYCTKSEMTSARLFTSLTTAIRSYRLIRDLQDRRDELERLNQSLLDAQAAERAQAQRLLSAERALREAHETMEQCVVQRTGELSQAIAELESFTRMVSHDLRGPLTGLASISGLIQDELDRGDTSRIRGWLSALEAQTLRLIRLVDDLMNLSRVSKGELVRTPTPLAAVVAEALEVLALSSPAGGLPAVKVDPLPQLAVDAGLMRQVFVNLLGNALKFSRGCAVPHIRVVSEHSAANCIVHVCDNGPGFNAQRAAELFSPFVRLHGAEFEGSGIGLTIVRRIVERHGGRVWADNLPGGGARFSFSLPAQP